MKKTLGCGCGCGLVILFILCVLIFIFVPDDNSEYVSREINIENLRDYYTMENPQSATVMMYMIGSDLESDGGYASTDIDEVLNADLGDNVNFVLETGGTINWTNKSIGDGVTQRHVIKNNSIELVEDLGNKSVVELSELSDFVRWSAENYPADRYILILWNHGGGTALGYGCDEFNPDDMLELSEIGNALKNSGVKLDITGFDACLMGTVETAYMLEPYSDYFIASEEYEPGTGWYYTNWLNALGEDVTMTSTEIGKLIVDDYINGVDSSFWDYNTLALVDLREIPYVYSLLSDYIAGKGDELDNSYYKKISSARSNAKALGDGDYDQIDIMSYLNAMEEDTENIEAAIGSAVKYMDSSDYDTSGLAMYFPYDYPDEYSTIFTDVESFGYGEEIEPFFNKFLSFMVGGQYSAMSNDNIESDYEEEYNDYDWLEEEDVEIDDYEDLEVTDKGEYFALSLTDEEWESIADISIQVYLDDGEGYIDLGSDNCFEFDDDGDLKVDFDYYWVALDGQIVPFYYEYESDDPNNWYTYGYVPATLNNSEEIEIMIYWDEDNENGYVAGYRPQSNADEITVPRKGLEQFENGDVIDFSCDFYTYDGEFDGVYSFGDNLIVNGDIDVSYEDVGEYTTNICYALEDVYHNTIYTEMVELYFE